MKTMEFTGIQVLELAKTIGPDTSPCTLGQWCPFCLCAMAKGRLDDLHGYGVAGSCLEPIIECESDGPLVEARRALMRVWIDAVPSREQCMGMLDSAIAGLKMEYST